MKTIKEIRNMTTAQLRRYARTCVDGFVPAEVLAMNSNLYKEAESVDILRILAPYCFFEHSNWSTIQAAVFCNNPIALRIMLPLCDIPHGNREYWIDVAQGRQYQEVLEILNDRTI